MAKELSTASKCVSKQVGAIIVKDGRILSTGYNGTPAGYINCSTHWDDKYTKDHHDWSIDYEIHAEMNAIVWAAREGIRIEGSTLYCTLEPCFQCSKNMIQAGIKKMVYRVGYEYNDTERLNEFIEKCGVEKIQIE